MLTPLVRAIHRRGKRVSRLRAAEIVHGRVPGSMTSMAEGDWIPCFLTCILAVRLSPESRRVAGFGRIGAATRGHLDCCID